jgi:hypothetical protein
MKDDCKTGDSMPQITPVAKIIQIDDEVFTKITLQPPVLPQGIFVRRQRCYNADTTISTSQARRHHELPR